jgi:hypothetical protein
VVTYRCTKKLLARLNASPEHSPPPSTGALGDWYANLLFWGRRQLALFVSERSLLPVLVEAKDASTLFVRFREKLDEVLRGLEVPPLAIRKELEQMANATVTRTASRRVLGVMTEFAFAAPYFLEEGATLLDASMGLSRIICMPIRGHPCDEARKAFGLPPIESHRGS